MRPTRRVSFPFLGLLPFTSTNMALPSGTSRELTDLSKSPSPMGSSPTDRRQRLTLASNPPTSPGKLLTVTSASPSPPLMTNLASNICVGGTSFQSAGTCHEGLPASGSVASAARGAPEVGAVSGLPLVPDCSCGEAAKLAASAVNAMDFRKLSSSGFCAVTASGLPSNLKNHVAPACGTTATIVLLAAALVEEAVPRDRSMSEPFSPPI